VEHGMPTLILTQEDNDLLKEVLETVLSNLSYEISDTDLYDFKEQLKLRRDRLKKIHDIL
jgi:hypothetical protein